MSKKGHQILDQSKINKIIRRIAIEVVENNFSLDELIIVGVLGQGTQMAEIIAKHIEGIKPSLKTQVAKLTIDKLQPAKSEISLSIPTASLNQKVVLLVDDVLNTGRTQAYSLSFLLQVELQKLETAVLVTRSHTSFPISVTYNGIALSTTIDEHIEVRLKDEIGAYLY
ncbi:MAG: phosphoribosyltransferase [Cyclobacteriaceae bacterium]